MTTHDIDIELPPLPKASKMYDIPGYDEEELKDYARAAVEADRKRRGEPVALTMGQQAVAVELLACFQAWEPMVCVLGNVRARDGAELMQTILSATPQPAEPVKVPSDADILELWTGDPTHSRPVMGKNKVIAFARALLARYGQQGRP